MYYRPKKVFFLNFVTFNRQLELLPTVLIFIDGVLGQHLALSHGLVLDQHRLVLDPVQMFRIVDVDHVCVYNTMYRMLFTKIESFFPQKKKK